MCVCVYIVTIYCPYEDRAQFKMSGHERRGFRVYVHMVFYDTSDEKEPAAEFLSHHSTVTYPGSSDTVEPLPAARRGTIGR